MGLPKRLTEMQRKFAEFLVFGDNGKALDKDRGGHRSFSPNRCRHEGYELTNPKIHPLWTISESSERRNYKNIVTFEGHIAELDRIVKNHVEKDLSLQL